MCIVFLNYRELNHTTVKLELFLNNLFCSLLDITVDLVNILFLVYYGCRLSLTKIKIKLIAIVFLIKLYNININFKERHSYDHHPREKRQTIIVLQVSRGSPLSKKRLPRPLVFLKTL